MPPCGIPLASPWDILQHQLRSLLSVRAAELALCTDPHTPGRLLGSTHRFISQLLLDQLQHCLWAEEGAEWEAAQEPELLQSCRAGYSQAVALCNFDPLQSPP